MTVAAGCTLATPPRRHRSRTAMEDKMDRLKGKVILISGGARGQGAFRPLWRTPAIVSFLNPYPALSLVGGNRSSCPTPAVRNTCRDRLNRVVSGHSPMLRR